MFRDVPECSMFLVLSTAVFLVRLHFKLSLHFAPGLRSAVCILYLVYILYPVYSLQSAFCTDRFCNMLQACGLLAGQVGFSLHFLASLVAISAVQ